MNKDIFIETPRLLVEKIKPEHFDEFRRLQKDPDVMHFMGGAQDDEETDAFIDKLYQHFILYGFSAGLVILKETGEIIGQTGLIYLDFKGPPDVEIGCFLKKTYWRKGYATELVNALLEYAFEILKLPRVFGTVDPLNYGTSMGLEKVGFTFIKEDWYDTLDKVVRYYVKERPEK